MPAFITHERRGKHPLYTLHELEVITGAKEDTIYRHILNHNVPHRKRKGKVVTTIQAISGYKPRSNPHWLLKLSIA